MLVRFHTLGCRLNQSETAVINQAFADAGYRIAGEAESAQVCVINTCTVTSASDGKCRNTIKKLIRENPEAVVAVVGCYAEAAFDAISKIPGVDLVVGNEDKMNLLRHLPEKKLEQARVVRKKISRKAFEIQAVGQSSTRARSSLKVQDGCDFVCSFCIIPRVRGPSRSRKLENLLDEAKILLQQDTREVVLTGVNIGTFDEAMGGIPRIVDELDRIGFDRVRISSIEPTTVDNALLQRMADPSHALVPHLHLPLQSGSDKVLKDMRRRYTREEYLADIYRAKSAVPGICIGTDILLGFPSESDEDFALTCSLLQDHPLDYAHAFTYSIRKGTPAAGMQQIDPAIRKQRTRVVHQLSERKRQLQYREWLGLETQVLFEYQNKGRWWGHTANFIPVSVLSTSDLVNQFAQVLIQSSHKPGLHGKLLA